MTCLLRSREYLRPSICLAVVFWTVAFAEGYAAQSSRPNVILILTDDQGYGDVSLHENAAIATPNMDRIANEGVRLDRFFVEPVCAPTRAGLLTGRYPIRMGVFGVTGGQENMRASELTIAEVLRDNGYATGCFGKWHNGAHWPCNPNGQGFAEFFGFCGGHWNEYFDSDLQHNGKPVKTRGFIADVLTDRAIGFIEQQSELEKPFFCYVPYNTPHTPASVPLREWRRWNRRDDVEDIFTRAMYALCENLDFNIGRILDTLEDRKLDRDTIVVFMTDNGPNGERFNDGMRGRKGSEHEGGVRVPAFIRWPGRIMAGRIIEENVAHIDVLPTLCSMVGIKLPDSHAKTLDGVDVSSRLMSGDASPLAERSLFTWRNSRKWSVRNSRYRATRETLHDLKKDPGQTVNLRESLPEVHAELVAEFNAWARESVPESLEPAAIDVGHAEAPIVTLKAHEFRLASDTNGIRFSGDKGFANQWIDRWTDPAATASCRVKVVRSGTYTLKVRYAASKSSAGAAFKLQARSESVNFTITEPWESAPRAASEVTQKRFDGYLSREWAVADAGKIRLAAGEYDLQLSVSKMPGDPGAVMPEVKALILEFGSQAETAR